MSETITVPQNGLDLAPTLGPLYWGLLCSLVLNGINILQGWLYFPSHDPLNLQASAAAMLVLNVLSSALVAQSVYYYTVPHYGSLAPLSSITSELSIECLATTLIILISQGLFVCQLYNVAKLKKRLIIIPIIVAICAIAAFAFGIACTTVMFVHSHNVLADRSTPFNVFFGLAKGFGALTDIIATIAMCSILASSRTGMTGTNSLISTLVQYVMRRGVLVTIIQIVLLVTFHAAPKQVYWLAFHVNVTKLYANTFFSMLNGREHLRQQLGGTDHVSYATRSVAEGNARKQSASFPRFQRSRPESHYGGSEQLELGPQSSIECDKVVPMPTVTKTVVIKEL
ncbi:hypothetical protein PsYK624_099920 [Phanerochaete sordida]|uniref:DUF6534 domain-containing protein n=1 Tax=Phanerochaete sordida TaxID=48140 RepID=A0A9P3GCZ3_9APHY|nr:hypothetical protein PsYK624_099920 [Phanerochaete sordida]